MQKKSLAVGAAAGLLVGLGLVGGAAMAGPSGTAYTGCLVNGTLIQVAIGDQPAKACPPGSTKVTWNQTGPQGPAGDDGAPGADGAPGEKGEPGKDATLPTGTLYAVQIIDGNLDPEVPKGGDYPTGTGLGKVSCPTGKRVIYANAIIHTGPAYDEPRYPLVTEVYNADPSSVLIQWKQWVGTTVGRGNIDYELVCAATTP